MQLSVRVGLNEIRVDFGIWKQEFIKDLSVIGSIWSSLRVSAKDFVAHSSLHKRIRNTD